jgi:parallel beta-helix repeat protein
LSLITPGVVLILVFIPLLFASSQCNAQEYINSSQNESDQLLGYKLINNERGSYYLIGSKYSTASNGENVANKKETGSRNETEIIANATGAQNIAMPVENELESHIFNINSAEELRKGINNTDYTKKLFLLKSGIYKGSFYLKDKNNVIIMPDPLIKGSVIFDAENTDFNFALDNTSNVTIKGLTLKNGNNGVLLERAENCLIDNNSIYGFKISGIFVNDSTVNNSIINNVIRSDNHENNISGISMSESRDVLLEDNVICIGTPDINSNSYIDILLNNSFGNTIGFTGAGIIIEDAVNCGVFCDGDNPKCSCDSVIDSCQHFIETSNNKWSFKCQENAL